ncbi:hypothetical protein [Shimazuella alba]|uniref:Uncharacterized protein n=1 Tax=Shimazuella alba TaxID=2690964 RepID=A0A6I4W035_9BACL|nr:hypothetical protein [Shimazuella alba]MXQ55326.1 hypothetical protein [Shimazuella alba]
MGKIVEATKKVPRAYEAAYLEKLIGVGAGEAEIAANRVAKELKNALSDFLGPSVMWSIKGYFSHPPVRNEGVLVRAASRLEQADSLTFEHALADFLLYLKQAMGVESIVPIW